MTLKAAGIRAVFLLLGAVALWGNAARAQPPTAPVGEEQDLLVTRQLVREIQFMLLSLGLDPGPLDGIPMQLTNGAVRRFEQASGLPLGELQLGGKVPEEVIRRLRAEAGRVMFGTAGKGENASPNPSFSTGQPSFPATPPTPPKTPSDRFAACAYDPEDFHIGANRYTPDSFLQEGFDGSTARAIANLKDRLEEGRQIADRIGISALRDVQRQARVLQYFECRLRIEQASASKG